MCIAATTRFGMILLGRDGIDTVNGGKFLRVIISCGRPRHIVRKLYPGGVALAALIFAAPAFAADTGVNAPVYQTPPAASVPPYSWTGFYVGGHVGRAWSRDWTSTFTPLPSPEIGRAHV